MWTLLKGIVILASIAGGMFVGAAVRGTDDSLPIRTPSQTPVSELASPVLQRPESRVCIRRGRSGVPDRQVDLVYVSTDERNVYTGSGGEPPIKVQHELCHAHQHWTINGGAPFMPSDYNLESCRGTIDGG